MCGYLVCPVTPNACTVCRFYLQMDVIVARADFGLMDATRLVESHVFFELTTLFLQLLVYTLVACRSSHLEPLQSAISYTPTVSQLYIDFQRLPISPATSAINFRLSPLPLVIHLDHSVYRDLALSLQSRWSNTFSFVEESFRE